MISGFHFDFSTELSITPDIVRATQLSSLPARRADLRGFARSVTRRYRLCSNASSFSHRVLTGSWRRRASMTPSSRHGRYTGVRCRGSTQLWTVPASRASRGAASRSRGAPKRVSTGARQEPLVLVRPHNTRIHDFFTVGASNVKGTSQVVCLHQTVDGGRACVSGSAPLPCHVPVARALSRGVRGHPRCVGVYIKNLH